MKKATSKKEITVYIFISIFLQLSFLPTLCGTAINEVKFLIAIIVDILIVVRIFYRATEFDKKLYLTIMLTSFIWITLLVRFLSNDCG